MWGAKRPTCPFNLSFKKWAVHPTDSSKHPAYRNKLNTEQKEVTDK